MNWFISARLGHLRRLINIGSDDINRSWQSHSARSQFGPAGPARFSKMTPLSALMTMQQILFFKISWRAAFFCRILARFLSFASLSLVANFQWFLGVASYGKRSSHCEDLWENNPLFEEIKIYIKINPIMSENNSNSFKLSDLFSMIRQRPAMRDFSNLARVSRTWPPDNPTGNIFNSRIQFLNKMQFVGKCRRRNNFQD